VTIVKPPVSLIVTNGRRQVHATGDPSHRLPGAFHWRGRPKFSNRLPLESQRRLKLRNAKPKARKRSPTHCNEDIGTMTSEL
jgi:hypothetical protein